MTRFLLATVLVALAAGRAHAQATSGMLPNGATIAFEHRQIFDDSKKDGSFVEPQAGSTDLLHYFNLAHCNCARANVGMENAEGTFNYLVIEMAPASQLHVGVDFLAGTNCDMAPNRAGGSSPTCTLNVINSVSDLDAALYPGGTYLNFNLYQAVNANQTGPCLQQNSVANSIYALVDTLGGKNYNYAATQVVGTLNGESNTVAGVDTQPPPVPINLTARGGDGVIHVNWTAPTDNNTDINSYQALCAKADGSPALAKPSGALRFVTTASLMCAGADPDAPLNAVNPENGATADPDANPAPSGAFGLLDAAYVCGEADTPTATSLTIGGLANKVPYQVILVSVDLHGNYSGAYFTSPITPVPSTDLWEDLHNNGSDAQGGLCLLAETYGDDSALTGALRAFRDDTLGGSSVGRALTRVYYGSLGKLGVYVHGSLALRLVAAALLAPLVMLALVWHWLTLPGLLALLAAGWLWRYRRRLARWASRRMRSRAVSVAIGAAIVLLAGRAYAGGGYQPYWEDNALADKDNNTLEPAGEVNWHVGIRVGPYVPDIDKQLGQNPGPYKRMFGGARATPMLDVDWILWSKFGQLGVGVDLGYMQKTANTFAITTAADGTMTTNYNVRAADTNTFRLIPAEVSATYRFTWLDDEYAIPVVPYARLGLAYYLWWITANGSTAKVCEGVGMEPSCSQNKALGASLGFEGAIGLAIRAERIDAAAATSMRQSGIQHAGIFGELSLAQVNGFGSDTKLSVGDRTWFAGVDFEF